MRIVIVDSEETSREVIKQAINTVVETHKIKSGCKIVGEAADGRKGCEIIVKERPDLIIMDLELPGKNGLPLLKKIRSEQIHSRVLVITKDNDFDRTRQAISFGVDEYLLKPVKKVQIAKALQMIEDKLAGELVIETALSVENIFMACLNGQIHRDEIVDGITHEKYGFTLADRGNLFVVWLGNGYMEQREMTQKILEKLGQNQEFSVCVLPIDEWHLFTVIIYGPEKKTIRRDLKKRPQHKISLVHFHMRDAQLVSFIYEIIIQNNVQIKRSRTPVNDPFSSRLHFNPI